MTDLTFEIVDELLRYEAGTGKLFWRKRGRGWFPSDRAYKIWNALHSGKEAFTSVMRNGYRYGSIFRRKYSAHRVIWLLETGDWPPKEIDHINGRRDDNRIENLRSVTSRENHRNQCRRSDNTSGCTGVTWDKLSGKWKAQIMVNSRMRHVGQFDDINAAISARKQAEKEYGFHANHGRAHQNPDKTRHETHSQALSNR